MRVLFSMAHGGFARNFESLLRALDARGHEVTVLLDRPLGTGAGDDPAPLHALADKLPGLAVAPAPQRARDGWTEVGRHLRTALDYLRFLEPAYAPAAKARERAAGRTPRAIVAAARVPALRRPLAWALRAAERAAPVEPSVRRAVAAAAPDVLCVTPLIELGSPQLAWVRTARALGIPSVLCVGSWDHMTMRGGIHEAPDVVCVWNERQAREAVELHQVPEDRIVIAGAAAYDHWFAWAPGRREDLLARVGLDPARPFLLYAGSSAFIAPDEGAFVPEWIDAVRRHPRLADAQVLVRPHPLNPPTATQRVALESLSGVAVHPARGANPTDRASRDEYFDALHHAAAVAGVNTSAFVEAAIAGRPMHTARFERYRATQDGTLHFEHLLPAAGGPLVIGATLAEHAEQLAASVALSPAAARERLRPFVSAFVRPRGLDVPAADVLAETIEATAAHAARPAPRRLGGAALAYAARLLLRVQVTRGPA